MDHLHFADHANRLAGLVCWRLGWPPDDFWNATPAELQTILRAQHEAGEVSETPPNRAYIAALMEEFPDG